MRESESPLAAAMSAAATGAISRHALQQHHQHPQKLPAPASQQLDLQRRGSQNTNCGPPTRPDVATSARSNSPTASPWTPPVNQDCDVGLSMSISLMRDCCGSPPSTAAGSGPSPPPFQPAGASQPDAAGRTSGLRNPRSSGGNGRSSVRRNASGAAPGSPGGSLSDCGTGSSSSLAGARADDTAPSASQTAAGKGVDAAPPGETVGAPAEADSAAPLAGLPPPAPASGPPAANTSPDATAPIDPIAQPAVHAAASPEPRPPVDCNSVAPAGGSEGYRPGVMTDAEAPQARSKSSPEEEKSAAGFGAPCTVTAESNPGLGAKISPRGIASSSRSSGPGSPARVRGADDSNVGTRARSPGEEPVSSRESSPPSTAAGGGGSGSSPQRTSPSRLRRGRGAAVVAMTRPDVDQRSPLDSIPAEEEGALLPSPLVVPPPPVAGDVVPAALVAGGGPRKPQPAQPSQPNPHNHPQAHVQVPINSWDFGGLPTAVRSSWKGPVVMAPPRQEQAGATTMAAAAALPVAATAAAGAPAVAKSAAGVVLQRCGVGAGGVVATAAASVPGRGLLRQDPSLAAVPAAAMAAAGSVDAADGVPSLWPSARCVRAGLYNRFQRGAPAVVAGGGVGTGSSGHTGGGAAAGPSLAEASTAPARFGQKSRQQKSQEERQAQPKPGALRSKSGFESGSESRRRERGPAGLSRSLSVPLGPDCEDCTAPVRRRTFSEYIDAQGSEVTPGGVAASQQQLPPTAAVRAPKLAQEQSAAGGTSGTSSSTDPPKRSAVGRHATSLGFVPPKHALPGSISSTSVTAAAEAGARPTHGSVLRSAKSLPASPKHLHLQDFRESDPREGDSRLQPHYQPHPREQQGLQGTMRALSLTNGTRAAAAATAELLMSYPTTVGSAAAGGLGGASAAGVALPPVVPLMVPEGAVDPELTQAVEKARRRAAAEKQRRRAAEAADAVLAASRSAVAEGGGGGGRGGSWSDGATGPGPRSLEGASLAAKRAHLTELLFQRQAETWAKTHRQMPPRRRLAPTVTKTVEKWFSLVDDDRSGHLEAKELATALRAAGLPCSEADILELVTLIDMNRDGRVSWAEFQSFLLKEMGEGKNLTDGEYVLPSGKRLPFGAMIARLQRLKVLTDVMKGGQARNRYVDLLYNRDALAAEIGMADDVVSCLLAIRIGADAAAGGGEDSADTSSLRRGGRVRLQQLFQQYRQKQQEVVPEPSYNGDAAAAAAAAAEATPRGGGMVDAAAIDTAAVRRPTDEFLSIAVDAAWEDSDFDAVAAGFGEAVAGVTYFPRHSANVSMLQGACSIAKPPTEVAALMPLLAQPGATGTDGVDPSLLFQLTEVLLPAVASAPSGVRASDSSDGVDAPSLEPSSLSAPAGSADPTAPGGASSPPSSSLLLPCSGAARPLALPPVIPAPPAVKRPDTRAFQRALMDVRHSAPAFLLQRLGLPKPLEAVAAAAAGSGAFFPRFRSTTSTVVRRRTALGLEGSSVSCGAVAAAATSARAAAAARTSDGGAEAGSQSVGPRGDATGRKAFGELLPASSASSGTASTSTSVSRSNSFKDFVCPSAESSEASMSASVVRSFTAAAAAAVACGGAAGGSNASAVPAATAAANAAEGAAGVYYAKYGAGNSRYKRWSMYDIDPASEDPHYWQAKAAALLMRRTKRAVLGVPGAGASVLTAAEAAAHAATAIAAAAKDIELGGGSSGGVTTVAAPALSPTASGRSPAGLASPSLPSAVQAGCVVQSPATAASAAGAGKYRTTQGPPDAPGKYLHLPVLHGASPRAAATTAATSPVVGSPLRGPAAEPSGLSSASWLSGGGPATGGGGGMWPEGAAARISRRRGGGGGAAALDDVAAGIGGVGGGGGGGSLGSVQYVIKPQHGSHHHASPRHAADALRHRPPPPPVATLSDLDTGLMSPLAHPRVVPTLEPAKPLAGPQ